jgi:hypothetical protein
MLKQEEKEQRKRDRIRQQKMDEANREGGIHTYLAVGGGGSINQNGFSGIGSLNGGSQSHPSLLGLGQKHMIPPWQDPLILSGIQGNGFEQVNSLECLQMMAIHH